MAAPAILPLLLFFLLMFAECKTMKMIHRNSHSSPFRKPFQSRLEFLRNAVRDDVRRLNNPGIPNPILTVSASLSPSASQAETEVISGASVGAGQYFVEVKIGTPPKPYLLIADTGSDLVWVNCRLTKTPKRRRHHHRIHRRHRRNTGRPKRRRPRPRAPFIASKSATFKPVQCFSEDCRMVPGPADAPCNATVPQPCEYLYTYSDRSESAGIFAYDNVWLENRTLPDVALGCSMESGGGSFKGSDGVLGLGQGPISFITQIGNEYSYKFSYCLVDHLKEQTSHSYLVFGDRENEAVPDMQMTSLVHSKYSSYTYYHVRVESLEINSDKLRIPSSVWKIDETGNGGTIFDTGSTLTYLLTPAYEELLNTVDKMLGNYSFIDLPPFDLCFDSSSVDPSRLPSLTITFAGDAVMTPPVDNFLIEADDGVRCLGVLESSGMGSNVIGNLMQQNFLMEFDRKNAVVSFSRTHCSVH